MGTLAKKYATFGLNLHRAEDASLIADLEAYKQSNNINSMSDVLRLAVQALIYGSLPHQDIAPAPSMLVVASQLERIASVMEAQLEIAQKQLAISERHNAIGEGIQKAIGNIKVSVSKSNTVEDEGEEEFAIDDDMEDPNDILVKNLMNMKFDY